MNGSYHHNTMNKSRTPSGSLGLGQGSWSGGDKRLILSSAIVLCNCPSLRERSIFVSFTECENISLFSFLLLFFEEFSFIFDKIFKEIINELN